jgi:hypothetical protein
MKASDLLLRYGSEDALRSELAHSLEQGEAVTTRNVLRAYVARVPVDRRDLELVLEARQCTSEARDVQDVSGNQRSSIEMQDGPESLEIEPTDPAQREVANREVGNPRRAAKQAATPIDPRREMFREAVIKKVKSPHLYRSLSTPEVAAYFDVEPRTIHRWRVDGDLRRGARRGSITIESVLKLEKRRSRKRQNR